MHTALDVAKWFLTRNEREMKEKDAEHISNLKLQKLLYYAQGVSLALYDKALFNDEIVAWKHGPVVEIVYQEYKKYRACGIDEFDNCQEEYSADDEDILEQTYNIFGQYSAWKLREKTHGESPWINAMSSESAIISNDSIKTYFIENYVE